MTLPTALRTIRLNRKLSMTAAAQRTGISLAYWSKLEAGTQSAPEPTVRAIAAAMGVDPDALVFLAGILPADVESALLFDPRLVELVRAARCVDEARLDQVVAALAH